MSNLPISGLPAGAPAQATDRVPIGRTPFGVGNTFYLEIQDILDASYFNLVGTGYIGGDQTGDPRGAYSLDVQSYRAAATEVAGADYSSTFGTRNTIVALSSKALAIGDANYIAAGASQSGAIGGANYIGPGASGSFAFGFNNSIYDVGSCAFGYENIVTGDRSFGFGRKNTIAAGCDYSSALGYLNDIQAGAYFCTAAGYYNIVAAGAYQATAVGCSNEAQGVKTTSVGYSNRATDAFGSAVGYSNLAGFYGSALGYRNEALGDFCSAFGFKAISRVDKTTNICGPQIIRRDDGEDPLSSLCGVETVLMSNEVDLKSAATITINIPATSHFWLDEVFVEATSVVGLIAQPFVSFGITGNDTKYVASTQTTLLTADRTRERFSTTGADGEDTLTATVVTPATGTTVLGRFGFRGLLIEDE